MNIEIQNEDDFLFKYYQITTASGTESYPKVTYIPKGKRIAPDIDLLTINSHRKPPLIVGFEFKLLKYDKRSKDISFYPFYTGLGQAMCYLQKGIDRVCLVIGCFNIPEDRLNLLDKIENKLNETCEFICETFDSFSSYLAVDLVRQDREFSIGIKQPKRIFPVNSYEDIKHKRECMLRKEFSWGKRWLKQIMKKKHINKFPNKPKCFRKIKKLPKDTPYPEICLNCNYLVTCSR